MPFYPAEVVIFDCDSTLSAIEGIDELARRAGLYDRLAPLTEAAMDGHIPLDEVYAKRLELIKPSHADVAWLGRRYVETMVQDADTVVTALQKAGKQVHIVSGGLRSAVLMLASRLGVPEGNVHAVDIRFTRAGEYDGFDESSPLCRSGGKKIVCATLAAGRAGAVIIGDAITDREAMQDGIRFIGFGGVVRRDAVEAAADDFIVESTLKAVLERLLPS